MTLPLVSFITLTCLLSTLSHRALLSSFSAVKIEFFDLAWIGRQEDIEEKLVEGKRGVHPRLEIYQSTTSIEAAPEDVNGDERDATIKFSPHDMLVAFRGMKDDDAIMKPTLTVDTSETITTITPLFTRVPSLLIKDKEHLKAVSSESGSVLTPTPLLIENGGDSLGSEYSSPVTREILR
jgi:hypothetical protein